MFVKNASLEYGGFPPYVAVFGQHPRGLFSIETSNIEAIEDGGGVGARHRKLDPWKVEPKSGNWSETIWLREIALRSLLESVT